MDAYEILAIKRPEGLFSSNVEALKKAHRYLARKWHPDANKSKIAPEVFAHVQKLYEEALKKVDDGSWGFAGNLILQDKKYKGKGGWCLKYYVKHAFELGEYFVGDNAVVYVVDPKHDELFENSWAAIRSLKYPSIKVEKECKRYLPHDIERIVTVDGKLALAVRNKTPDLLPLRDVLSHYGGKLPPTQAAWILSTLLNLGCYLWTQGITHNDISLDSYFISPEHHSGALLGGWWYAMPRGHTLTQLPKRTFNYLPWKVKNTKKASRLTDQELIRLVGRELLGGADAPGPMTDWLKAVATEDAITAYRIWQKKILPESFGARRFVKMDLTAETLYNK